MICCINPNCPNPQNPDGQTYCISCGLQLVPILRNRFRMIKLLGQGGFGRTYLAEDIDRLNQPCVVKQLAPDVQGTWAINKAVELFQLEARQLQQLGQHPQIPSLDAYFEDNKYLYLVQQFVDGDNLLTLFQNQGIWQESQVKQLLLELLPVLKFIHEQKIIHRDIKPENIMRRRSDGLLMLIDFGVSKQLSGTVISRQGTQIGSHGYAPLEQMQGGEAYAASDLFSLGATAFHLLTGVHPYGLWTEHGYSWTGNWQQHLKSPIDKELELILSKLLAKDIQQRYQSAEEVLRDFQGQSRQTPAPIPIPTIPVIPQHSLPLRTNTTRRGFLQLAGFAGGGFALAVLGQSLLNKKSSSSSPNLPPSSNKAAPSPKSSAQKSSPKTTAKKSSPKPSPQSVAESPSPKPSPKPAPETLKPTPSSNALKSFTFETVTVNSTGQIANRRQGKAQAFIENIGNAITLEMVAIPGGSFVMGSPDTEAGRSSYEGPQRTVNIPAFFMGQYEITQEQYQAVMGNNPSEFKGAKLPVEKVSWNDAVEFCKRLSQKTGKTYRLPSQAEWEYACRAGTKTPFYFGETITPDLVNYNGNNPYAGASKGLYRTQTTDVGNFSPNAFGLYDMHGNVWEWCSHPDNDRSDRRVRCGGSWKDAAVNCRSAYRLSNLAGDRYSDIGFRVALVSA
ncbi:bifunctional serine/threonine-protein kinase/formylglycine-generating enzyme family protein [Microcoleus sp. MON2_D6]|uniref:bifunctional serine/threonine-protein kinase/formylglycine-generating enzyme family protein n=1 Tax=unclassified Microcoleus TaxID=2642155 RepID=UPI002FD71F1F